MPCQRWGIRLIEYGFSISDDEQGARLNCIHHLPGQMPYREVAHADVELPARERREDDIRHPVPEDIVGPEVY